MWNRNGGPQILQMFQIQQNSDLPLESCKNKSPVTHFGHRKREKWGLSTQPIRSFSHLHVRQSEKVCRALFLLCCMISVVSSLLLPPPSSPIYLWITHALHVTTWCMSVSSQIHWQTTRRNLCVNCAHKSVCFLHFPFPLSLVSCSLHHLPLSVCPLGQRLWTPAIKRPFSGSSGVHWKNPHLNSADPTNPIIIRFMAFGRRFEPLRKQVEVWRG